MKKEYSEPQIVTFKMEMVGMLAMSTDVGGDATEPALSPDYGDVELN